MKKRLSYLLIAWLLCLSNVMADNIIINDVTVPQGGTVDLTVKYSFTSTTDKVGFTFSLGLPAGISLEVDGDGDPVYTKDDAISKFNILFPEEGNFAGQPSNATTKISGTEGTLLTLHLIADNSLTPGTQHVVNVTKCTFQQKVDGSVKDINIPDFTFNVTIGKPAVRLVVLDETSTTALTPETGVNVRVKRTINAGTWSTICLPFAMSADQVKTAFGNDVELGDFIKYEITVDANDKIAGLTVNFEEATAMEANHPYIIKVSDNVTEFTVDGVNITPEDDPCVEYDNGRTGTRRQVYGTFMGTYVADFDFFNYSNYYGSKHPLFLNGGKFYYATANTKHMKAFRAYFDFQDCLADLDDNGVAPARAMISFGNDGTTRIANANIQPIRNGHVYSLSGQYLGERQNLGRLPKGVYIIDGKKEVVK